MTRCYAAGGMATWLQDIPSGAARVAADSVTSNEIADGTITSNDVAYNALDESDVNLPSGYASASANLVSGANYITPSTVAASMPPGTSWARARPATSCFVATRCACGTSSLSEASVYSPRCPAESHGVLQLQDGDGWQPGLGLPNTVTRRCSSRSDRMPSCSIVAASISQRDCQPIRITTKAHGQWAGIGTARGLGRSRSRRLSSWSGACASRRLAVRATASKRSPQLWRCRSRVSPYAPARGFQLPSKNALPTTGRRPWLTRSCTARLSRPQPGRVAGPCTGTTVNTYLTTQPPYSAATTSTRFSLTWGDQPARRGGRGTSLRPPLRSRPNSSQRWRITEQRWAR